MGDFQRFWKNKPCRKIETKIIRVPKIVKLCILSSVATLEAYKSENVKKTNCYNYKMNTIKVILEWFLIKRTAATNPRFSIFTLALLKIRASFKWSPMLASLFLKEEKRNWQTLFTIENDVHGKVYVFNWNKIGRNLDIEKLLQTKSALEKLVNWVQLNIHSERTMHQKRLRLVLNGNHSDGLISLKRLIKYNQYFWNIYEELAKKRPKILKTSEIAVFCFLVNELPIEIKSTVLLAMGSF